MLVRELSLALSLSLWSRARTGRCLWTHPLERQLFRDRRQGGRRYWAGRVSVVTCQRVLPNDVNDLPTVLKRCSRGSALTFRALLGLGTFTNQFGFRDVVVFLPRE